NPNGISSFPVKRFVVPVDPAVVKQSGLVQPTDTVGAQFAFAIPENKNDLMRSDLVILNMIAANNWKRPIYFTSPFGELGFGQYLRKDGLAYLLTPVPAKAPQETWVVHKALQEARFGGTSIRENMGDQYENLMKRFHFGGADLFGVYFDEENRRHLLNIRATMAEGAGILADAGRTKEAQDVLARAESGINPANLPYAMVSRYNSHNQTGIIYLEAAYKAGNTALAAKLRDAIGKDLRDQRRYYEYLRDNHESAFTGMMQEYQINEIMLQVFDVVEQRYNPAKAPSNREVPGAPPAAAADSAIRP
ncbi:MAG TPA: DUF2723 domain-containing protein, partial [Chitinophagaceae bacterium]|nr:DUF2723 domain-containing protein [Chitinophagaceae bacterium]